MGTDLINVKVGAQFLQNLFALTVIKHQVNSLTSMATFHAALRFNEPRQELLPVASLGGDLSGESLDSLEPVRSESLEQIVFE